MAAAGYMVACARLQGREESLIFEGQDGQCDGVNMDGGFVQGFMQRFAVLGSSAQSL